METITMSTKEISRLEDLAKLPFTEKAELRESQIDAPPLGTHMACDREQVKRVYSTSGTTGRPTFIGQTSNDIMVWREAACRAFWTGGFRPDSSVPLVVAPFFIAASYADAIEHIGTLIPFAIIELRPVECRVQKGSVEGRASIVPVI